MNIQGTQAQTNSVQQFSALNAFKSSKKLAQPKKENEEVSQGVNTTSAPSLLERVDVNDIRECAKTVGEYDITDDDIKYGLIYGRSVIAEWLC